MHFGLRPTIVLTLLSLELYGLHPEVAIQGFLMHFELKVEAGLDDD